MVGRPVPECAMTRKKTQHSSLPEALRHPAVRAYYPSPLDAPAKNPYLMPRKEMFEILRKAKILTKSGKLTKVFK
jgi:hypothetical protein